MFVILSIIKRMLALNIDTIIPGFRPRVPQSDALCVKNGPGLRRTPV